MKNITAIIVDDELAAAENISILLDAYCPEISVIGMKHSISSAIPYIKSKSPDLLFLDISMPPEGTGFDLLELFPNRKFHVIFVTAHEEYSLQAIKQHAFDYLLKPIDYKDLIVTMNHFMNTYGVKQNLNPLSDKISLSTDEGTHIIRQDDILFCKASGSYTEFHLINRAPIVISKSLKYAESILNMNLLKRVHRSFIINPKHINRINKEDGGSVSIGETQIPISKNYCSDILNLVI